MLTGQVKSYDMSKGCGFIQPDDGGEDIFLNANAVERAGLWKLLAGQKVSFIAVKDRRSGTIAVSDLEMV
jgi:CspA family cold shock protein